MATKAIKVKAHKRLSGTGKIENVDAHLRKIEKMKGWKTGDAQSIDMKNKTVVKGNGVYEFEFTKSGKDIKKDSVKYLWAMSQFKNTTYGG